MHAPSACQFCVTANSAASSASAHAPQCSRPANRVHGRRASRRRRGAWSDGQITAPSRGAVQPSAKKYLPCHLPKIRTTVHPSRLDREGRNARSSRDVRRGCGGRLAACDERNQSGRRNRVVLAPLGWRQAGEVMISPATVTNKSRTPGRSRISRNPSRRECRMIWLNLW